MREYFMAKWTIICNPNYYDIFGAFKKLKKINWKQPTSIEEGDIVYIYITKPIQEIRFKCKVTKTGIPYTETNDDDSEFDFDEPDDMHDDLYMEIELINRFNAGLLTYKELKENGLKNIQGPSQVSDKLRAYLSHQTTLYNRARNMLERSGYYKQKTALMDDESKNTQIQDQIHYDKNIILYGPPGTGKTYYTAVYAVAICDGKSIDELSDYNAVMRRYNELKSENRIAFTTFHQSYGYEEFIEGIKPFITDNSDTDNTRNIEYTVESGVFKKFCDIAGQKKIISKGSVFIKPNPVVWKVSLEGSGSNKTKTDCFKNGRIRIGWKNRDKHITDDTETKSTRERTILTSFEYAMEIGDIVCVLHDQFSIDGIGIITGEYEWLEDGGEYPRSRNVWWLANDFVEDIRDINGGKVLTSSTIYKLNIAPDIILEIAQKYLLFNTVDVEENTQNYVFIIDEINRGNISKIFGELITLIEPTKRKGANEAMEAILPYSGKPFGIPDNVYILGTMNTADRSIAIMDTALRRRFKFIEMMPDVSVIKEIKVAADGETLDVSEMLAVINKRIELLYDREHTIGHAFFTGLIEEPTIEKLASIFQKSVIPLLQEYFYEDYQKIQLVLGDNGKTKEEEGLKFIKDLKVVAGDVFSGSVEDIIELPDTKYEINPEAFYNIHSYKKIAKWL